MLVDIDRYADMEVIARLRRCVGLASTKFSQVIGSKTLLYFEKLDTGGKGLLDRSHIAAGRRCGCIDIPHRLGDTETAGFVAKRQTRRARMPF